MKKKPWQQLDKYYNDIIGDDFLQAEKYFRKFQDEAPEKFALVTKHCGIDAAPHTTGPRSIARSSR